MKSAKSINPIQSVIQTTYDIIKAHGGELTTENKESSGAAIIIILPIT